VGVYVCVFVCACACAWVNVCVGARMCEIKMPSKQRGQGFACVWESFNMQDNTVLCKVLT